MKPLLKNYLSLNKFTARVISGISLLCFFRGQAQVINYINNGGFEEVITSTSTPLFYHAKYWGSTDTNKIYGEPLSAVTSPIKVPKVNGNIYIYQWPRTGNNDLGTTLYCPTCPSSPRGYPRNRLKQILKPNTAYCFSMYVNLANNSSYGIDAIGAYFGGPSLDTITKCTIPLTYITPHVQNPTNNVITDTLNWVLIQGQFTATGNEKYALIGNFKSNSAVNSLSANPAYSPAIFSDYHIDDVSLIELDLPAYAGGDTVIFAGDSVFLGRKPDIGINDDCTWYKLPGTSPIDTIAGFWIKPTQTCTYVVRQEICGLVKWDTIRIYMDAVGIEKLKLLTEEIKIYPVPANEMLELKIINEELFRDFKLIVIYNNLGQVVREEQVSFKNKTMTLKTGDLPNGVYSLQLRSKGSETTSRRFVIAR